MTIGRKAYVRVIAEFNEYGIMYPRTLYWENGIPYEIDKVTDVKLSPAFKAGGIGDRYTIWVKGKQRYLFFERTDNESGPIGRWFVEI